MVFKLCLKPKHWIRVFVIHKSELYHRSILTSDDIDCEMASLAYKYIMITRNTFDVLKNHVCFPD